MLIINKNLNVKDIRGKKYRSPFFSLFAIFSIPFVILDILISLNISQIEERGVIIGLVSVVILALPVALLLSSRKISYIVGEERLYFFNSQVIRLPSEKRKKKRCVRTNGSVCYSDIRDFRYLGMESNYPWGKTVTPPRVVIISDDFEVEVYAYKKLINRIKALQK